MPMRHLMVSGGRCEPTHQGSEGNICVTVNASTGFKASRSFIADEIPCRHYFSQNFTESCSTYMTLSLQIGHKPEQNICALKLHVLLRSYRNLSLRFFTLYSKIGMFENTAFSLNFGVCLKAAPFFVLLKGIPLVFKSSGKKLQ